MIISIQRGFIRGNERRLTAMEGLEDRLGLWLRRMSTAPTTSESMATSKASVAYTETTLLKFSHSTLHAKTKHAATLNLCLFFFLSVRVFPTWQPCSRRSCRMSKFSFSMVMVTASRPSTSTQLMLSSPCRFSSRSFFTM